MTAHEHNTSAAQTAEAVARSQGDAARGDELLEIIRAYNAVTENLQKTHESLRDQVARLQAELASTNAQLQRSKRLAALGEMAAGIAHEIRNPLAAIRLYATMIEEDLRVAIDVKKPGADLWTTLDAAGKLASATRGLDAIVTDVLAFAREIQPRPSAVDVISLFDRAIASHEPAIIAARVRVDRRGDETLALQGDADLLHQALLNVVRNAVDAMSDHSVAERVLTLDVRVDEDAPTHAVISVADTGPGVPAEVVDRIFNPFFTTRSTGTGLGLAIVHRIIDAHGGTVAVAESSGSGAVFEIRVPLADDASLEAVRVVRSGVSSGAHAPRPGIHPELAA